MNNQINTALSSLYPGHTGFSNDLISLASSLNMKSQQLVQGLKPNEEPARIFICTLLAAEQLEVTMNLPAPNTKKAPVPPRTLTKLINMFRVELFPNTIQPSTPSKRARKTGSNSRTASPIKAAALASQVGSPQNDGNYLMAIADATDRALGITSEPSTAPPTPKRKIIRGGPKSGDPRKSRVIEICREMGIAENPTDSIIRSYKQYNSLVKDRWGLLCGIIVVIATKAHPRLVEMGTQGFYNKLIRISHTSMNQEKLDEWISWSSRIINDQSWVKRVTNPRSKEANYRIKTKKYSSGIGNMVSISMRFIFCSLLLELI